MKSAKGGNTRVEILIAEDSATQREQLRHLLQERGYSVVAGSNGKNALEAAQRHRPDLIISDIVMPELDGYGLCKAIKADKSLRDIPVMLVTTLADPQDVIRGLECGADNFLRKPYDERYLLSRIDYLLMNLELRKNQKMQMGMEINLGGQKHFISSERQQILDLLISTYEQAVEINSELKQREEELAHSNQVLNALYRIAEGLNQAGSEREVAETVLERALELPGIQAGWISLREGESSFRLAAARNLPPALEAPGAMDGDCACRRRLMSGELDSVTNILECERLRKAGGDNRGLRYHASVPLWLGDRTLGVMNLVGPDKGLFNDDELRVLYGIGNQVAVALERAHLYEHLEHLVQERTAALEAEIAERKRIEKEQARLVAIIEATPDFIGTSDPDGNVLFVNQAGLDMLGYHAGEGMTDLRIAEAHPEWAAKLVAEQGIPHAVEHGSWSGETAFLRRDGREIPVSQVIIAHKSASGSVEYLSTVARDITRRRLSEEALKKSRTLLNETGKLANVGGWELYIDTQEVVWTEEVYRIHEVELTYKPTLSDAIDFYAPSSKPIIEQAVRRAIEHGKPFDVELEIVTAKGNRRWVHAVGKADREHRRVHGAFQDITERKQAEAQLNESNERLRQISENIHEVFWMTDAVKGEMLYISPAYQAVWGRTADSLYASPRDWIDAVHIDDRQRVLQAALTKQVAGSYDEQYRIVKPDGSIRWIHDRAFPVHDSNGEVYRVVGVAEDITLREENEKRIRRLNRVYAVLSGVNTTIVRTRDRQELFDESCRIAVEHGQFRLAWIGLLDPGGMDVTPVARAGIDEGYIDNIRLTARENVPGSCALVLRTLREKTAVVCNDIATDPQMARWREQALQRGYRSVVVFPLQLEDKVTGLLLLYASEADFFDTEEMKLLTEIAGDISFALDHLEKAERLNYLAYYDVLTGLPNRALFYDRVDQRIAAARRDHNGFAVVVLDLERFRDISDTLGQHAGDDVLRQVARRLQGALDDTNVLARLASNSFAITTPPAEDDVALGHMVEQALSCVHAQPFEIAGKAVHVAAKAGVATFPADGSNADTLHRNAAAALGKAKQSGERFLFYAPEFNARVAEKLTLENKLRRALARGELVLHYQPKFEIKQRRVSGVEALMRWNDPDSGLVYPGKFIPVLEETGLILEAGRWALEQATADFKRWQAQGLPAPRIAVNVSPLQLREKDFVATVERALSGAESLAGILQVEITESMLMQDIEANIKKLRAVRDIGVEVTVDDFGTGYSSLSYISRLPIDALKIDRTFIVNITANPDDLSIVSTIISLAHSLNLKVVAEGVENEEQANLLRLLKCDAMQGYLFSPAVPAERLEVLLLDGQRSGVS